MNPYLPEGRLLHTPENQAALSSPDGLARAMEAGAVLEGMACRCDPEHNLWVDCGGLPGFLPREEAALGVREGLTRDIAVLSRVGWPVSFVVEGLEGRDGRLVPRLSRRKAQERALRALMARKPGDVIPVTVTHLEPFGAFVDMGCGLPSLIGVERISVSRIPHPVHRFTIGQPLSALVIGVDPDKGRLLLSHRELLGTWLENARQFSPGEMVPGVVRSIQPYGAFVELTPNLSGLAEPQEGLREGDRVAVCVKAILPEKRKLKLLIIHKLPALAAPPPFRYFVSGPRLERWDYGPEGCLKGPAWDAAQPVTAP